MSAIDEVKSALRAEYGLDGPGNFMGNEACYTTHFPALSHNRDSGILDESNWISISKYMLKKYPKQCFITYGSHWAVGWTEILWVKAFKWNSEDRGLTKAAEEIYDIRIDLQGYEPIFDYELYERLEYEQTLENIKNETKAMCAVPDDGYEKVYSWLTSYDIYPEGDDNTWYSSEEIVLACFHLGFIEQGPWLVDWEEWLDDNPNEKEELEV